MEEHKTMPLSRWLLYSGIHARNLFWKNVKRIMEQAVKYGLGINFTLLMPIYTSRREGIGFALILSCVCGCLMNVC